MKLDRAPRRRRPWALGLLLAVALGNASLHAQEPKLLLADSAEKNSPTREGSVLLRPNTEQTFHILVSNPGTEKRTVTVALRARAALSDLLRSKPLELEAGETAPVVWDVPAAAPGTAAAPAAPAALELKNPNRGYQLVLREGKKELGEARAVELLRPLDYLDEGQCSMTFDGASGDDGTTGRLTARVVAGKTFRGPPAPVRLNLDPARIPGLVPSETLEGTYQRTLTGPGRAVELVADRLRFVDQPANRNGLVTVDVDGYERALTRRITFNAATDNRGQTLSAPIVRVKCDRYWRAGPTYHIGLRIDNVRVKEDHQVEVVLSRTADWKSDDESQRASRTFEDGKRVLPATRDERVAVHAGGDGALTFASVVRDWEIDLNAAGLYGDVTLRVRLLENRDGKETPVAVLDDKAALDSNPVTKLAVFESVTFDSSNPEVTALGVLGFPRGKGKPNRLVRGEPLTLYARALDDESKIQEVVFFVGRPTAEGALPAGVEVVPGDPVPADPKAVGAARVPMWLARMQVPTDKPGKVSVGVQVTNRAGMKTFGTLTIELVDGPKSEAKGPRPPAGTIEGTVTENDRLQPNVPVVLRDAQNMVRDSVKTDGRGRFAFKDIPPGAYRVQASKTASTTTGETSVQVQDGQTKEVVITLKRP